MSTVQEIQKAIAQLPETERLSLLGWIHAQEEGEPIDDGEVLKEAEEGARQLDSGRGMTLDEARKQTSKWTIR